jgi:hypothetical protein
MLLQHVFVVIALQQHHTVYAKPCSCYIAWLSWIPLLHAYISFTKCP